MTAGSNPEAARPLQVRQVRQALAREFDGLIDVGDGGFSRYREILFFSRALAAKAVRIATDCTSQEAATAVTDGADDFGIDAVAVSSATGELWLIQAKWSDQGTAQFTSADASKLLNAFRMLDNLDFDRFNARFQGFADRIHSVLAQPMSQVHLVAAVMGPAAPATSALQLIHRESPDLGARTDLRVLASSDLHAAIRQDLAPQSVTVTATFADGWYGQDLPYPAHVGTVTADEIALWYERHGGELLNINVRRSLGHTPVNATLDDSLAKNPENFWYFNNGITVLCESATAEYFGRRAQGAPVRLTLADAQIVNGAQTVASLYRAFADDPQALADVKVMVRIITVGQTPPGFASSVTVATNTQNHVEQRDFIALDPVQAYIRDDFRLTLEKDYIVKRGELEPAPDAGCTVLEAATALACAHPDARMVAGTRASTDFLWQSAPEGGYTQLFAEPPTAVQIWRSVQLLRIVQQTVHGLAATLPGRAAAIAESGALLVAHLVFQRTNIEAIDDLDADWQPTLDAAVKLTAQALAHLIAEVDRLYGPHSFISRTFSQATACRDLAAAVLASFERQGHHPELAVYQRPPETRRGRRPNPVRLLVDQHRLPEGTQLMYHPGTREDEAIGEWLNADPNRFIATWTNDTAKPLLWAADGGRYSLAGLILHMWRQAGWDDAPIAVQGSRRWALPGGPALSDLAQELWHETHTTEPYPGESGGDVRREDGTNGA
ncbi:AIPR family protein [Streptomyces sp. NPDC058579]|uniref:AIPR family protein n=1 Tax=Streptomyces sp. NPDC058579 TaxID=3346548 RepID=UPI003657115E